MKRALCGLLILLPLVCSLGCAMCCAPDDYAYPTYGGKWQRLSPAYGRVASPYSPESWSQPETVENQEAETQEGETQKEETQEREPQEARVYYQ
jgi:hypothetical protein